MNTWEDLPPCKRCYCSAAQHARKTGEKLDLDNASFTEYFQLGRCRLCDCPGYLIVVTNPRTCVKLEGFQ